MKERIKSFVLALLVLLSIGLTSITWIDERLWPDGYSLFVNVKEWPVIRSFFKDSYSLPVENLSKARKIVVADGLGSSAVFYNGDKIFNDVYGDIANLMSEFAKGGVEVESTTLLTKENVRQMLNEQIMYAYVNYSVAMPARFFCQLMGTAESDAFSGISLVRDFFVLPTGEGSLELLAVDSETENVMRYALKYEKTNGLIDKFMNYAENVDPDNYCIMALQMNMDIVSPDDVVKTKTLLDSFLVLDSASTAVTEKAEIESENPLKDSIPEEVIKCFSYNPNSLYRYVDGDGTTVYLENDSSLKIYKNGIIEYEAVSKEYGIPITGGTSLYNMLNSATEFAGRVYSSASSDSEFPVNVSGDIRLENGDEVEFLFDYYYKGTPVATATDSGMKHAVEITVSGGRIVKFRMLIRSYKDSGRNRDFINIYEAIDKVAAIYSGAETAVKIEDMFPAYIEEGENKYLVPCWVSYVEGERIVIY